MGERDKRRILCVTCLRTWRNRSLVVMDCRICELKYVRSSSMYSRLLFVFTYIGRRGRVNGPFLK